MILTNGKAVKGSNDEQNKTNGNQNLPPKSKEKKRKSKFKHISKWKHSDLSVTDDFEWNFPIPALDSHEPLSFLFEKFLTDVISQFVCNAAVRYAQTKVNHSYQLELHDLKVFITILLVGGYVDLPNPTSYVLRMFR